MTPGWMAWNLFLAMVPAALAVPLFRRHGPVGHRSAMWWAGVATFLAFLPNAPYVLTDVIHFADDVRATDSDLRVAFVLIPKYALFFAIGFGAYAFSIARLGSWLRHAGWAPGAAVALEVLVHGLCAVGVFLGRVLRFNSWDLVVRPTEVLDAVQFPKPSNAALLVMTFVVLAVGSAALRLPGAVVRSRSLPPSR